MTLHFQETDNPSAPTILLVHGGGGAGWLWKPQVERLREFHCLVPDLPQHGQSSHELPFSIANSAGLLADLIRNRAHQGKANVVGLSVGAQVALALLAQAPELVERAVLSSALVSPSPGMKLLTPGVVACSYRWFVAPFKQNDWWVRINMKYAAGVPETYFDDFRRSFQDLTESSFTNLIIENQRFRLPSGLQRVRTPTLVVCGRSEYRAMRRSVRVISDALPNARGYAVHHAPKLSLAAEHNWNLTAPDLFTELVRAWCEGRPLPESFQSLDQTGSGGWC